MATIPETTYRNEYARYRFYFHRIISFYQKPAAKVSTALLLTVVTIVFFAVFAIQPTLVTIAELLKKIDDQKELLERLKTKSAALATASQEYALAQPKLELLDQTVPVDYAADRLVYLLEGLAAEHGLAYASFSLSDQINFYTSAPPDVEGEKVMPLTMRLDGTYEQLLAFVADIQKLIRLVGVDSIRLDTEVEGSSSDTRDGLALNLSAQVFYLPLQTATPTPMPTPME